VARLGPGASDPGEGEELVEAFEPDGFAALMRSQSPGFDDEAIAEYWKTFADEGGWRGVLELYRSGDFSKLEPYRGKLAELDVPTLILWGEDDPFAPVAGAYRFTREIPHAELVVLRGARHFLFADEPDRCAREVVAFLARSG
jgi:haloalkane dehalogenase